MTQAPQKTQPRPGSTRLPAALAAGWIAWLLVLALNPPLAAAAPATYLDMVRAKRAGRPNIILILADDLGYGDLGCYGQTRIRTPNLDRLAGEGMRFTQCYAGSTVCAPSRAVLMTGLHTGHTRIRGNQKIPLGRDELTLAKLLRGAGYRTAAIGKWGLGNHGTSGVPNAQGFDEWFGYLDQTQAHDYYPLYLWRNESQFPLNGNQGGASGQYSHDLFTHAALTYITNNCATPFFLYLAYTVPHANNELGALTGNGMQVPDTQPYTAESWPAPEKAKAAMITRLDADVGRLLQLLQRLDLDGNTLIFFTSDNGPHREGGVDPAFFESAGPLRGIKRDLYEGGIRVPMIARWRGQIPAGRVSDQVWSFADLLPTFAAIAQVGIPHDRDGISMLPTLFGTPQPQPHPFLYWEFHENGFHQAIRLEDWKAVRHGLRQPVELYDLRKDPQERFNVADQQPEVVRQIEVLLSTARNDSPDWPLPAK